jgi:hypothetical protein
VLHFASEFRGPELEMDFHKMLKETRERFEFVASVIKTVETRLLVAGAVVMVEDDKRPRRQASPI